ncbi:MAG: hypothetical protein GWP91_20525, partial [Rhodobacterales bacterium]|nr:hypothetical protein [Rhodobacterales bacterium]
RDHPWRLPDDGTLASVARITPSAIARWHRAQFEPKRVVAGVTGGVDAAQVLDHLGPILSSLPTGQPLTPRPIPRALNRTRHQRRAGQHQAIVICAVHTPAHPDPMRRALEMASSVLDATGGRLFMELRERRGLGYTTWAEYAPGMDGGAMRIGVTCAPDRVREAEDALRAELTRLTQKGPTPDELARTCRYLDGVIAMRLQRASGRASHIALSALWQQSTDIRQLSAERAAVTPDDICEALQHIELDHPLTLVVRPD